MNTMVQSQFTPSAVPALLRPPAFFENTRAQPAKQAMGVTLSLHRNATIFEEGDPVRFSYKLVSGTVRLYKLFPDGRRQIITFYQPGDVFGLEDMHVYPLNAETVTNSVIIRHALQQPVQSDVAAGDFHDAMTMLLRQRLSTAMTHLVMLGRATVRERIASFLLQTASQENQRTENGDVLELPMGRQDIADYLGLTIETVCRAISSMKRAKIISVPNTRQIVFRDVEKLRAVAEGRI